MESRLRKMWLSPTEGTATVECGMHTAEQLRQCNYREGYFLFPEQLEQLEWEALRKGFEAGRARYSVHDSLESDADIVQCFEWLTFADYEANRGK